jgi:hypothetical protein
MQADYGRSGELVVDPQDAGADLYVVSFLCGTHNIPPVYCTCKEPDEGDNPSIECDYCCDWYHYSCEGISNNITNDVRSHISE